MKTPNLEIERKFLIEMPDENFLSGVEGCRRVEITQVYTTDHIRLRRWAEAGRVTYVKTIKKHITDMTRIEIENEIEKAEYDTLLKTADPRLSPVSKTRYIIPFGGNLLEIDLFPFWKSQAYLEIELEGEDDKFTLPDYIKVIKEVTEDKRYRNYALAQKIPEEEEF